MPSVLSIVLLALAVTAPSTQDGEAPPILVTRQLAASEGLEQGQIIRLAPDSRGEGGRPFRIAGVYEPVPDPARLGTLPREVRLHLPDLLALTRLPDVPAGTEYVEAINIALVDPAEARNFARDLNARMPGVSARPAAEAAGSGATFQVLRRFHLAIALVTIIASTVFLLALTIMLVDERRETVGLLRLIGLPVRRILVQIFLEGLLIATAGGLIGLLLASASESLINAFFQWRYDTALVFVRITPYVAAACLAVAVPLGTIATVTASWVLLRRNALRLARR
ncbi:MAG: ABC transporter permease [Acidobacteria bacterium]|nr:ABC transporter permease [Acidobacteriota bacterium]